MKLRNLSKFVPLLILAAGGIIIWLSGIQNYISFNTLHENQIFLQEYILQNHLSSIAIFCILYFLVVSLSIPGATIMTIMGGLLFGQTIATLCAIFSSTFGACVIFLSAKMATKDSMRKKAGTWTSKLQKGFSENAFSYMLTLRLMPIFPFVMINLVAGILQIPLRTFFFGTLIGIIPGTFIYVSVGVSMQELLNKPDFSPNYLLDPQIIFSLAGLGFLALLPVIYKWFKGKK